jgi:hypothetical protein
LIVVHYRGSFQRDAGQWMDGRDSIFKPIDVQAAMLGLDLLPAPRTKFGCSQTMPPAQASPAKKSNSNLAVC